jgi:septum formation protein
MAETLVLASTSEIRITLLRNAGVNVDTMPARVDEETITASLIADGAKPRDIADMLAEIKARKISEKFPNRLVLGCDQVLDFNGKLLNKPKSQDEAVDQLGSLRGQTHKLFSAAVIYEDAKPVWRAIGQVRVHMRVFSDEYLAQYVDRNWDSIQHSVGGYKLEEEGSRLMARVDGDYFTVLGLPLLDILSYLSLRGFIQS